MALQRDTASGLDVFELVDAGKVAVDERRVGQRPEMLGRRQLGRIGRQKEQMDVLGDPQAPTRMPPSPIQHEDDLFLRTSSHLSGKGSELDFEEGDADGGSQMKDGTTRGGIDEAHEVAPFKAMLDRSQWPLAIETPDLVQDGLEANAMFVHRPQFDLGLGKGGGYRLDERTELFLKATCSVASACT